jgi:hypothetical protein
MGGIWRPVLGGLHSGEGVPSVSLRNRFLSPSLQIFKKLAIYEKRAVSGGQSSEVLIQVRVCLFRCGAVSYNHIFTSSKSWLHFLE